MIQQTKLDAGLLQTISEARPLDLGEKFKTLDSFLSYVQRLRLSQFENGANMPNQAVHVVYVKIGQKPPFFVQDGVSCVVPSWIDSARPCPELQKLFLGLDYFPGSWRVELNAERPFSEYLRGFGGGAFVVPNIEAVLPAAKKINPFLLRRASGVKASQQFAKLDAFVLPDVNVVDLTLTFPKQVSVLLLSEKTRPGVLALADVARKKFFKKLSLVCSPEGFGGLGVSSTLHPWSSKNPTMPQLHWHNLLPAATAPYTTMKDREFAESLVKRAVGADWRHLGKAIAALSFQRDLSVSVLDVEHMKRCWFLYREALADKLGVRRLERVPVLVKGKDGNADYVAKHYFDGGVVRGLWHDVLVEVFPVEMAELGVDVEVDVHLKFASCKTHVLHLLGYKSRSPLTDLDKFLRDHPLPENANLDFLSFLVSYRPRTFCSGFWSGMKALMVDPDTERKSFCPITGVETKQVSGVVSPVSSFVIYGKKGYACFKLLGDVG